MADALLAAALLARLPLLRSVRCSSSCPGERKWRGVCSVSVRHGAAVPAPLPVDASFVRMLSAERLILAAHLSTLLVKLKAVASGIKTADLLFKAVRVVQAVVLLLHAQAGAGMGVMLTPDGILVAIRAAKVMIKGFKLSHKALKARGVAAGSFSFGGRFKKVASGIKAWWGAMDLVRGSQGVVSEIIVASDRVSPKVVIRCYEATKGALSTVEALASLKVGFVAAFGKGLLGLKAAVGGMGVMIKAFVVSKELYVLIIKALGLSQGAREVFNIIAERRRSLASCKVVTAAAANVGFGRKVSGSCYGGGGSSKQRAASSVAALALTCLCPYKTEWPQAGSELCPVFSVQGLGQQFVS